MMEIVFLSISMVGCPAAGTIRVDPRDRRRMFTFADVYRNRASTAVGVSRNVD
jgi:hypothetical protein